MAKQKTVCLSRHWLENVRVVCWTSALMVALCPGSVLRAADSVFSNSPSSNAATASLEYQETGYNVFNWSVSVTPQPAPFKKEPVSQSGSKVMRGVLNFGGGSSNAIAFVWQRSAGKLYLDLNRNRDLTDDPAGVFSSREAERSLPDLHQCPFGFQNCCRPMPGAGGPQLLWVGGVEPDGTVELRSFWQGKVTLKGRDWQVGIVQNDLERSGSFENGQLLLRPWEKRNQPFNASSGSLATVPFSRNLFVDGHAYQLDLAVRSQDGEAKPSLQFTEQSVALGELKITGKFIQRLVLSGGPYLVVLDQPAGTVKIPVGSYSPSSNFAQTK